MTDFFDPDSDDGRGYVENDKPNKNKGWWWKDYDYDYRDYSYTKGSGSRSWMSKIGSYGDDYWKPKKDQGEVYQDLLNQLQNSANLIGDTTTGKVNVHWSNGNNVNDITNDSKNNRDIYLSPDNLLTDNYGSKEVSEEVLDALTGKVYLASTLRDTVDPKSYSDAKIARVSRDANKNKVGRIDACPCDSGSPYGACCMPKAKVIDPKVASDALTIWEAIETSIARNKIVEDWAGFGPYIAGDSERSSATKQQVQDYIDASVIQPSTEAASLAIAWNLLNSSDPVNIPDCYNECIEEACNMMENEIDAEDRFSNCVDLSNRISTILKSKGGSSSTTGDGDSKSGGSPDGSGEDDGSSAEGGTSPKAGGDSKKKDAPKVCDGSLLGDKVKNDTNKELSEQEGEGTPGSPDSTEKGSIRVPPPNGCSDLGKNYELDSIRVNKDDVASYKRVVMEHISEIRSIRSSMQFRANLDKMHSYGHRSGDIDENSLFKIRMDDDRVMTKTDVVSAKKIAICLLVDESGSMGCGTRVQDARNTAIILAESLRGMDGISVSVYGHSAEERRPYGVNLREYYSPRQKNLAACMQIDARCQNHDSYAILHTANLFKKDYGDYDRKIMFVISDGEPGGGGYGGAPARKHMLTVSQACDKQGIEVYGVGVDNAYSIVTGKTMYGDNRCVVLKDVKSSLGVMSRFVRQIAMK